MNRSNRELVRGGWGRKEADGRAIVPF